MFLFEQFITNIPFSKIKYDFYSYFRQVVNNINLLSLILIFLIFLFSSVLTEVMFFLWIIRVNLDKIISYNHILIITG